MYNARNIAEYFLVLGAEEGDLISNLKIQKLVYYAQGFHLALNDEALFNEPIKAWEHGPVVPSLYHDFKEHGSNPISPDPDFDTTSIDEDTQDVLNEVYAVYGQFSAWKLRNMTHDEPPWRDAYAKAPGTTIPRQALKEYFQTRLVE